MRKAVAVLAVLAVITFGILNLACDFGTKPDLVLPMANTYIEWNYAGK